MERMTLMRYIGRESDWEPHFALKAVQGGALVIHPDGEAMTFSTMDGAVSYAREHGRSIEWEGTTF